MLGDNWKCLKGSFDESHMRPGIADMVLVCIIIKLGQIGGNQCLKRVFESHKIRSINYGPGYFVYINHSLIGENHLKIFKNSFWKKVQKKKRLLYPHFDSLILALF